MNAYYLHKPDGTKTDLSACGVCGKLARGVTNFDLSERCCTCYGCGLPLDEHERKYANTNLYHRECENKRRSEREAARLDKAAEVTDYDGPVFCDGRHGSYGDGYFENADELAESYDSDEGIPEFAYCCQSTPVASLDLDSILESHCDEAFEDAVDHLLGVDDLRAAVEIFNKLNAGVVSWYPDYAHKVRIAVATPGVGKAPGGER